MSLLYQNRKVNEKINSYHNDDNNLYELKKTNDSMSEKIKQNQKQKAPLVNQNGSNISSGLNTEKRNIYKKNYYNNDEINYGIINRNGSQSSLSVDLNRFKINPNSFNNIKHKETVQRLYSNNNNINLDENFETFNPRKDQIVSINNSKGNININNINNINNNNNDENLEIIENTNIVNNTKKINKSNKDEKKNANSFLKNFNPYDIKNFLGNTSKKKSKKINLVNNIPPSASNLQMILYNKKVEDLQNQKNPEFLFSKFYQKESRRMIVEYLKLLKLTKKKNSINNILTNENINQLVLLKPINEKENNSLNNSINHNNLDNSYLASNRKHPPFSINNSPKSNNLIESSSKNILNEPNSFRILNNFLNDMDDESKDKISLITFLSIPRIMKMVISQEQTYSYVFYCSPTNISCLYGIETYIFKWNECKNYNLVGYFDLINVENCYLDNKNKKIFNIILNSNKNNIIINNDEINNRNNYCIETDKEEIANNYVHAISFASQLVKYRIYLNKKKEGK